MNSILILAPEADTHTQAVLGHLRAAGRDADVLDTSLFPQEIRLHIAHPADGPPRYHLALPDRSIDLERVGAAWWRRPQPPKPSSAIAADRQRLFAANESQEALAGLWHALDAHWVNDPARDHVAHRKVYQLRVAEEVGLKIPETLITNDPREAREFIARLGAERVVYKAFSAMEDQWRETRLVREDELSLLDNVQYAPVIFQEYIEATYDLRVTVVGKHIFPAAIHAKKTSYPIDCRMDIANAPIETTTLPKAVEAHLHTFMERLGLVYGAIDLRLDTHSGFVFLEINPAGQWLFIEERTAQPISRTLAHHLITAAALSPSTPGEASCSALESPRSLAC